MVERKLAQCTRHGVAIELQLFAHLGKRRRIKTGLIQQGHDTLASLAHHAYRRGGGMRVEHLGTVDGAHARAQPSAISAIATSLPAPGQAACATAPDVKPISLGAPRAWRQGRSQHIHCSIESRGICVEHRTARSKLAHGSLVHKPTQNDLDLAGNKIERCGNTGSSNRQRLQRQPRVYAVRDISGLKRRIQRALPADRTRARRQRDSRTRPPPSSEIGEYDRMTA